MKPSIKHRVLGAIFIVALVVIIVPDILDESPGLFLDQKARLPNRPPEPKQDRLLAATDAATTNDSTKPQTELRDLSTIGQYQAWSLVLGNFDEATAKKWQRQLQLRGLSVYVKNNDGAGQMVLVGPELKQESLRELQRQLESQYGVTPKIVPFEPATISTMKDITTNESL